jgi:hypothetical protein
MARSIYCGTSITYENWSSVPAVLVPKYHRIQIMTPHTAWSTGMDFPSGWDATIIPMMHAHSMISRMPFAISEELKTVK